MIKGFDAETAPLNEREMEAMRLIAAAIQLRVGERVAVTGTEITNAMGSWGYKISGPRLRKIINYIRTNGIVKKLCATSKGYFVAETPEELNDYIIGLTARIEAQQQVLEIIKQDYELYSI